MKEPSRVRKFDCSLEICRKKFPKFIKIPLKWSKALPYLFIHLFARRRNEAKRTTNRQCKIRGVFSLKQFTRDSANDKRFKREIQQQQSEICIPFQTVRKASNQISFLQVGIEEFCSLLVEVQAHFDIIPSSSSKIAHLNESVVKLSRLKRLLARLGFVFLLAKNLTRMQMIGSLWQVLIGVYADQSYPPTRKWSSF